MHDKVNCKQTKKPALFHLRCPSQSNALFLRGRTRLTTVTTISCRSLLRQLLYLWFVTAVENRLASEMCQAGSIAGEALLGRFFHASWTLESSKLHKSQWRAPTVRQRGCGRFFPIDSAPAKPINTSRRKIVVERNPQNKQRVVVNLLGVAARDCLSKECASHGEKVVEKHPYQRAPTSL
ncbi:unnamed protein product [Ectocarpus sp. 12 AP-2014]